MKIPWPTVAGWYHAVLLGALPWCAWWNPRWAPLMIVGIALVHSRVRRSTSTEPWSSVYVTIPCTAFLIFTGGWSGSVWFWLAMAAVVALAAMFVPRAGGGRPDAADCLTMVCWAAPFAANPGFLEVERGGWLAPAVLLLTARRLGTVLAGNDVDTPSTLGPPTREVRGTLSLRGVVATAAGLPETAPLELDLRAGESLAVLCRDRAAGQALADVLAGRTRPQVGEVFIDGGPLAPGDRLAAVIGPGEIMVAGGLDDNLGALRAEMPDRAALGAARDACGLSEVAAALERPFDRDGWRTTHDLPPAAGARREGAGVALPDRRGGRSGAVGGFASWRISGARRWSGPPSAEPRSGSPAIPSSLTAPTMSTNSSMGL